MRIIGALKQQTAMQMAVLASRVGMGDDLKIQSQTGHLCSLLVMLALELVDLSHLNPVLHLFYS